MGMGQHDLIWWRCDSRFVFCHFPIFISECDTFRRCTFCGTGLKGKLANQFQHPR